MRAISNHLILIPGYMQRRGDTVQGIPRTWQHLWNDYPEVCVQLYPWNTDWSDVAETILRSSRNETLPKIMVVGYSWGVGYGVVQLLRELNYRGLSVESAVFSDGVYHLAGPLGHKLWISQCSAYLPRPSFQWPPKKRPIIKLPGPKIPNISWYIQDNFVWKQRRTYLRGHDLVWKEDGSPVAGRININGTVHKFMDDCTEFQTRVTQMARETFGMAA